MCEYHLDEVEMAISRKIRVAGGPQSVPSARDCRQDRYRFWPLYKSGKVVRVSANRDSRASVLGRMGNHDVTPIEGSACSPMCLCGSPPPCSSRKSSVAVDREPKIKADKSRACPKSSKRVGKGQTFSFFRTIPAIPTNPVTNNPKVAGSGVTWETPRPLVAVKTPFALNEPV